MTCMGQPVMQLVSGLKMNHRRRGKSTLAKKIHTNMVATLSIETLRGNLRITNAITRSRVIPRDFNSNNGDENHINIYDEGDDGREAAKTDCGLSDTIRDER
eukprot:CAMPEP_0168208966 /NCGR_PEP_ID=MMETSP0140_2-20121125/2353_1 /TAXON_ID=44445 /ORGANISM="Pseudo-nitzschia australis, Strain 10249 10 AB" /LENGTH=101 /DNA_ID=CAMNT_0008135405 /DNA_START=1166 /DNA_END=1471 /DNA_ORIENTATION=+